jgi:hypothetical protein
MAKNMLKKKAPLQVVVVTDTSSIISSIKEQVEGFAKVLSGNNHYKPLDHGTLQIPF